MFFKVNQDQKDVIAKAVEVLASGGVMLYPCGEPRFRTLACDATSAVGLEKILSMKTQITQGQGLVFVQDEIMLENYICKIPNFVKDFLYRQEKAVTVIFNQRGQITPAACNFNGKVGVRIVGSVDVAEVQMSRHVLRLLGKPIFVTTPVVESSVLLLPKEYSDIDPIIRSSVDYISPMTFAPDDMGELSMVITYEEGGGIAILRK